MKKRTKLIILIAVIVIIGIGITYTSIMIQKEYDHKKDEPLLERINLEDITDENGLIFRIERNNDINNCDSVFLLVYSDGTYKFTTTKLIQKGEIVHPILEYEEPISGTYEYDIKDIFLNLKQVSKKYYKITTGSNETYLTDKDNEKLITFLKEIDVDLDTCMQSKVKE